MDEKSTFPVYRTITVINVHSSDDFDADLLESHVHQFCFSNITYVTMITN